MNIFKTTGHIFSAIAESAPVNMRLDSITNRLTGLGTTEDSAMYGTPTLGRRLDNEELMKLYVMSDLAQRIVDEVVDDALRQGFLAKCADTGEEIVPPSRLNITEALADALKEARSTGGAAILPIVKGVKDYSKPLEDLPEPKPEEKEEDDGEEVDEEDDSKIRTDAKERAPMEITGLLVLDRTELSVRTWDYDPMSPSFGKPLTYTLNPRGAIATDGSDYNHGMEIHRSRLMLFHGQRLPKFLRYQNDDWGDSVLQASWDRIRNFEQTELAMGNIVQRFEVATYSIDGLGEVLETPEGKSKILERLKLIQKTVSMVRAVVLDKQAGETYERNFTSVNGLDTIWDRLAHSVAKSARMSMTQLFGAAPSGLATDDESGRANWRKQIKTLQTSQILPALQTYFEMLHGKPVVITFAALDEATATEEAEIKKSTAEMRKLYIEMGAATPTEFRPQLVREGIVSTEEMDEDDLAAMDQGNPDDMAAEDGLEFEDDPGADPAGDTGEDPEAAPDEEEDPEDVPEE